MPERVCSLNATHIQCAEWGSEPHLKSILKMKVRGFKSGSLLNEDPLRMCRYTKLMVYLEETKF